MYVWWSYLWQLTFDKSVYFYSIGSTNNAWNQLQKIFNCLNKTCLFFIEMKNKFYYMHQPLI